MKNYDVVVVGSGPGGYIAAAECAKKGLKVAIVEKSKYGGVCLNIGCIPTKTLLKSAKVFNYIKHSKQYGIDINNLNKNVLVNWDKMQIRKAEVVLKLNKAVEFLMKSNKVDMYNGFGEAVNQNTIKVNNEKIEFKNLILATGSKPRHLPFKNFEKGYKNGFVVDSTGALNLKTLPKHIVVIGGGIIGTEFAFLFNALGCKVTILQALPTILEMLDEDVIKEITNVAKSRKIKIITEVTLIGMQNKSIVYKDKANKKIIIKCDNCLESVGRVPVIKGFESLNLKTNHAGFIETNEYCQTNLNHIYAIGDVNGKVMLAHKASAEAIIVAEHLKGSNRKMKYDFIPNAMYTFPEAAAIGQTEQQLKNAKIPYIKNIFSFKNSGKALADNETYGFIKILASKKYKEILGAHLVGSTVTDIISEIAAVIESEGTITEIAHAIHPHPTMAEAIFEVTKNLNDMK